MNTSLINEGDWIKYWSSQGWTVTAKVLDIRPDDVLIVGQHDNDPDTTPVQPDDVTEVL